MDAKQFHPNKNRFIIIVNFINAKKLADLKLSVMKNNITCLKVYKKYFLNKKVVRKMCKSTQKVVRKMCKNIQKSFDFCVRKCYTIISY